MISERLPCVVLTLAGAMLLAMRVRSRAATVGWLVVLVASVGYAVGLTLVPENLININIVHYYLGAKYPIPYSEFYRSTYAAIQRPQVKMRDLNHPPATLRGDTTEQRAYFIDLLRSDGQSFDPLVDLASLRERAMATGAVAREADTILRNRLPARMIPAFKEDVRRALVVEKAEQNIAQEGRWIGDDYGFNGSPLYTAVRSVDPTLHRAFDRWVGIVNLAWQVPALFCSLWLMGWAIGLDGTHRLAAVALTFASWDTVGWSLPGLILAGLWLPVGLACWAAGSGRFKFAGAALAWSGLIKMFPFVLVVPSAIELAREAVGQANWRKAFAGGRPHPQLILSCGTFAVVLLVVTTAMGRSWTEFFTKIAVQFQSQGYLLNSVSLNQLLVLLGVFNTPVLAALRVLLTVVLGVLMWVTPAGSDGRALPRRLILLVALTGWYVDVWFNYYAVAALILIPWASRSHPRGAMVSVLALALAYLLPEFDDPLLREQRLLWLLKLLPYLAIPAWLAWVEFSPHRLPRKPKRLLITLLVIGMVLTTAEVVRRNVARTYELQGNEALDRGDARQALHHFEAQLRLSPQNGVTAMNRGIALAMLGRGDDALESFARAVSASPTTLEARVNYAHMLLSLDRHDQAMQQVEAALELSPNSAVVLLERARIQLATADSEGARGSLARVLELEPQNKVAASLWASLRLQGSP